MKIMTLFLLLSGLVMAEVHNIRLIVLDGKNSQDVMLEGEVRGVSIMEQVPADYTTGKKPTRKLTLREAQDPDKEPSIQWIINAQGGYASIQSNTSKIPNDDFATEFNLPEGAIESIRIYLSTVINRRHEIRLLFAPLEYQGSFIADEDILFNGVQFLAGKTTETGYQFNSYRLSYLYHLNPDGRVRYRIGFTGKIRDAYTLVRQDGTVSRFENVGFVPLLHLGVNILLTNRLSLDAEVEGSWAPQGYALDFRSSLNYQLTDRLSIGAGVGYLSGGANTDTVRTFSDIIFGFLGFTFRF
jgi:hypothetical protein